MELKVKVKCPSCELQVMLENKDIEERCICINEQDLIAKIWNCPECCKDHHVELDNLHSKEKFEILKSQVAYNDYRIRTGAALRKTDIDQVDKKSQAVENTRNSLKKEFKGTFYQWGDHKNKLDFKVPEVIQEESEEQENV